jgi:hypothetical protein
VLALRLLAQRVQPHRLLVPRHMQNLCRWDEQFDGTRSATAAPYTLNAPARAAQRVVLVGDVGAVDGPGRAPQRRQPDRQRPRRRVALADAVQAAVDDLGRGQPERHVRVQAHEERQEI